MRTAAQSVRAILLLAALVFVTGHEVNAAPSDATLAQPESVQPPVSPDVADDMDALLDLDVSDLGQIQVAPGGLSSAMSSADVTGAGRQSTADSPGADIISGSEAATRNTTDAGSFLGQSQASHGVYVQQRSPIIGDPRIRGYHFGQYLARADGAFWYPARQDADSIISKIDSWMIDDVVVLSGPYSARYGPGFSFIDIASRPTPRYEQGRDAEGSTGLSYNANGQQWNGHEYIQTGDDDWGALIYYSHMTGSDYEDGAGQLVPSSYKSRNLNAAIGTDLSPWTSVEFRYLRQDQTDVELAGQFTDIDYLSTDGFSLKVTSENTRRYDLLTFDAWYNQVRGHASGGRASKQDLFNEVFDAPAPGGAGLTLPRNSESDFDVASTGFTLATTWGQPDDAQATLGTDLRHYERGLSETLFRPAGSGGFQTATRDVVALIPDSHSTNPGIFAELVLPVTNRLKVTTGGRADWVAVSAGPGAIARRGSATPLDVLGPDRDNSFDLWSAYVTGEYDLTPTLTANAGFALAQRPPTLTELYAMRPFESVLQQGLNRIQGYPFLHPERLQQLDAGLETRRERFRGGVRVFHAWIDDYITSQGISVDPTSSSARITSVYVNTPEATLAGGETFGEWDVAPKTSLFGSAMYVEGRNHTLNHLLFGTPSLPIPPGSNTGGLTGRSSFDQAIGEEPLPQIPPLESRLGIRWHEAVPDPSWEIELSTRIVDNQDRFAGGSLLEEETPGFTTYDVRFYWRPYDDLELIGGVLNFTDKLYREHLDTRAGNQLYQPGITGYVGFELSY